jgi:hypothetical protein
MEDGGEGRQNNKERDGNCPHHVYPISIPFGPFLMITFKKLVEGILSCYKSNFKKQNTLVSRVEFL